MASTTPVLDLVSLTSTAHVRIDGELYSLRSVMELPLIPAQRLETHARRIGQILAQDATAPDDEALASRLLDDSCRIVLDAPPEVHARLTDTLRLAILNAFSQLRQATGLAGGARPTRMAPSTGAKRSRGSNGSTGAIRKAG